MTVRDNKAGTRGEKAQAAPLRSHASGQDTRQQRRSASGSLLPAGAMRSALRCSRPLRRESYHIRPSAQGCEYGRDQVGFCSFARNGSNGSRSALMKRPRTRVRAHFEGSSVVASIIARLFAAFPAGSGPAGAPPACGKWRGWGGAAACAVRPSASPAGFFPAFPPDSSAPRSRRS